MTNEYILTKHKPNIIDSDEFTMPSRALTKEEIEQGKNSEWYRLQLTGFLRFVPVRICNFTYVTTLILKNNLLDNLPKEIGRMRNLRNIDATNNQIVSVHRDIGFLYRMQHIHLANNKLTDVPDTFGFLHNIKSLDLRQNPLMSEVKQQFEIDRSGKQLVKYLMELYYQKNKLNAPPPRKWQHIKEPKGGFTFTLMCYNVLCQKYATTNMYPYCPTFALDWEYRKRGILEEIWKYNADIICLQELETQQYEDLFSVELKKRNYDSLFVPKSRSRTMHESDSKNVDGCAIFWKVDCFEKVVHYTHEFMLSCIGVSKNPAPELLNRVMNRDNVALSLILEVKDPKMNGRHLCVSTGHIHWDPEYSDVKLIQTLFWTSELWNYIKEYFQNNNITSSPTEMPVIFCGDLNSLPNSGVIDYLMKGEIDRAHVDFRDFGDKYLFDEWNSIQEEFVENDVLKHHYNFDRAYKDDEEGGLRWSNYTYDFRGVIDYIFFTKEHLRLLGLLQQIPEQWFESQNIVGAPHVHINSDHFSLLVELELAKSGIKYNDEPNIMLSKAVPNINNNNNTSVNMTNRSILNNSTMSGAPQMRRQPTYDMFLHQQQTPQHINLTYSQNPHRPSTSNANNAWS